ncbi:hypothetical protein [Pseudomonas fontis]|uniref:Uncharacterized protein n=1 Tax=Pseudomonas fontis TaxID=2942633 RepID=A0ABT5NM95_9PSED|nr:hypothetical protein [Pseudomonas fontis]MDD0976187.1 hypothetical protein [Pseudomonas fontis]MDD0989050.1 hypothetical protein [Pseudomonas fontis]
MATHELIPSVLFKLNENQVALAGAVEALSKWVEQHGSTDVAQSVRVALSTVDNNLEHITRGIAELMND